MTGSDALGLSYQGQLDVAIHIAVTKHAGQLDKGGEPYILHPLRVMAKMPTMKTRILAVLHDVLEDTDTSDVDLFNAGIDPVLVHTLVTKLSRGKGQTYERYIERLSNDPLARTVKIEDLRDNMQLDRLRDVTMKDVERIRKYQKALRYLLDCEKQR